jgi:large subunit ribosomal protein L35Ae
MKQYNPIATFLNKINFPSEMEGTIVNFRGSKRVKHHNQMIIKVEDVLTIDKAKSILGMTVVWKSPAGKELRGKISSIHGNKGALRAIFENGMPGQCIGTKVIIQ